MSSFKMPLMNLLPGIRMINYMFKRFHKLKLKSLCPGSRYLSNLLIAQKLSPSTCPVTAQWPVMYLTWRKEALIRLTTTWWREEGPTSTQWWVWAKHEPSCLPVPNTVFLTSDPPNVSRWRVLLDVEVSRQDHRRLPKMKVCVSILLSTGQLLVSY